MAIVWRVVQKFPDDQRKRVCIGLCAYFEIGFDLAEHLGVCQVYTERTLKCKKDKIMIGAK